MLNHISAVMAGLVPAIHVLIAPPICKDVDARDKRGHDDGEGRPNPTVTRSKLRSDGGHDRVPAAV